MGSLHPRVSSVCMGQDSNGHANTVLVGTRAGEILEIELPNEKEGTGKDIYIYRLVKSHYRGDV